MSNYYTVKAKGCVWYLNKKNNFFFFSKKPSNSTISKLPDGYGIKINSKTGMPLVKKK